MKSKTATASAIGVTLSVWLKRMRDYAKAGYALDLEENEDRIRCVAAPVRDATECHRRRDQRLQRRPVYGR